MRALWRLILHTLALILIALILASVTQLAGLRGAVGGLSLLGTLGSALVVGLGTWLCARTLDHRRLDELGLHLGPRWWADLGAGFMVGAVLMSAIFGVELSAGWLTIEDHYVGAAPGQPFALALLGPWFTFMAVAFYEELLSRGYHLRNLAEGLCVRGLGAKHGPTLALVLATLLSASVFGLLHAGNDNATLISTINVGLAGCMLALGLLWTGELALPIGLHMSWNFFQGNVFGFPVSGNAMGPRVFQISQGGDPLVTGGAFGPEAGLIGVVAMVLGALLLASWVRLTRGELRLWRELALREVSDAEASSNADEAPHRS